MTKRAALSLRTALLISLTMGLSWFPVAWADLNDGLVAYYPFDGDANDESGNGNHGSENGGLNYVAGKIGQAASFDGNSYVEIPYSSSLLIDGQITISAWVKLDWSTPNGSVILQKGRSHVIWDYGLATYYSYPSYRSSRNDWIIEETRNHDDNYDGEFHLFTVVVNESESESVMFYLDGNRVVGNINSHDNSIPSDDDWIRQSNKPLQIGLGHPGVFFVGQIDDLRVYNRALTKSEIQQLYQIGNSSLQLSATNYDVNEGDNSVIITVTRTGDNQGAISVDYATSDNTAIAGSDYTQASGTFNWSDGDDTDRTFTIKIIDDSAQESDERLIVSLGNPTGGVQLGTPNTAIVTIIDNDSAFSCKKVSEIPKNECNALVALYDSTKGENWENNSGWNVTNSPCSWNGVSCQGGHVTELSLGNNNLKGSISKKFFKLKWLKKLDLSDNEIDRSILKYVNKFKKLNSLLLNNCLK
jgi:hypothetical protein